MIAEYIRLQGAEPPDDDRFKVSEAQACMRGRRAPLVDFSS